MHQFQIAVDSHFINTKDQAQHPIKAGQLDVIQPVSATPERGHHLHGQLLGSIATIATRLRHACGDPCLIKTQLIEHAFD